MHWMTWQALPDSGTAPKPGTTVPSALVEKNTGLTTARNPAMLSNAFSMSIGEGGVKLASRESRGGSVGCRGRNPLRRVEQGHDA
jgi:hypothetical protein